MTIGKLLLIAASFAVLSIAQVPEQPVFEVAAIKPNKSGSGNSESSMRDGRFTATNVSLKNLMQYEAYDIPSSRILGGPKWLDSERFDVEARADDAVADRLKTLDSEQSRLQTQGMFQKLLADRFKLVVHWETRDLPVYALVVAKKGPILQTWHESEGHGTSVHNTQLTATGKTIAEIAEALTQNLSKELGRNVIDKTGIAGQYDITLKWTPQADAASPTAGTLPADSAPSIFTAIQEQLGLRLESTKGPVQLLIIDNAEMPSEN